MSLPELMKLADGSQFVKPHDATVIMGSDGWLYAFVKTADNRTATSFAMQRWKQLTGDNLVLAIMSGLKVEDCGELSPIINQKTGRPWVVGDYITDDYKWKYSG